MDKQYDVINKVARLFSADVSDVLTSCLIETLVHILPLFAVARQPELCSDSELEAQAQYATSCYDELRTHVPQKVRADGAVTTVITRSDTPLSTIKLCFYLQDVYARLLFAVDRTEYRESHA